MSWLVTINWYLVAVVAILAGFGLFFWAYDNPKWQSADSFDSLLPGIAGIILAIVGALILLVRIIIRLVWLV